MRAGSWVCVAIAFVVATTLPATAEDAPSDDQAARMTAANNMFVVCGERDQLTVFFEKSVDAIVAAAHTTQPSLTDDQWTQYRGIVHDDLMAKVDDYIAFLTADYAVHFSVADIGAMVDFCRTPIGQKVSKIRSQMELETFDAREAWMRSAMLAAMQDAQQKVQTKEKGL
jgi:hypothetical protein